MQRAATGERHAGDDRAARRDPRFIHGGRDRVHERLLRVEVADRHVEELPADHVHGPEFRTHVAGVVHPDDVAAPGIGLARVAALGIAAVDRGGPLRRHDAVAMDVPQGPVVHPGRLQVADGAGGVVGGVREPAHVRVQQADGERRVRAAMEPACKVGRGVPLVVADPVDPGDLFSVAQDRPRGHVIRREPVRQLGPGDRRLPAIQRVVVPRDDI
jgi:hypothetical protein